jgi:Mrp family chromosome partitioning ATPase
LIDANLRSPNLHNILGIDHIDDLITDHGEMPSPIKVWPSSDLYILPPNGEDIDPINFYNHPGFCQLLRTMHERYDYVILDAPPPLHIFPETLILSSNVDGIVLVIEAGKIPWQIAATVKKRLEGAGGRILGVVLSKKKCYIPKFIDERL